MPTYRLVTYDVWGNDKDGYEVNNAFRWDAPEITLPNNPTDKQILTALKDHSFLKKSVQLRHITIDGDPEYSIYIEQARNSYPLCELENTHEEPTHA